MYIDPGAGSLAFQLLLSAGVGAVYTFRRGIARFLSVFKPKPRSGAEPGSKVDVLPEEEAERPEGRDLGAP